MPVTIRGIGVAGSFGSGVDALRTALNGARPSPQQATVERCGETESFPLYQASVDRLDDFFPKRALRRIDRFSKLTLLGACLALQDAGLLEADRSRIGVVIASGYGALKTTFDFLDSYLDFGYACSSPTHFSNSVHNAAAAHVSIQLQVPAPSLTVTQFEMSVPSALLTAQVWLAEQRVDHVLLGAVDEFCEVVRYCRARFFGAGEQGPIQALDFDRQSAVPGEGAAFLLLTRSETRSGYAVIDSVELGRHSVNPIQVPEDDLLIVGADGHRECGRWYAEVVQGRNALAYAPLYGSFPAAVGFDLAVAALSLRDGRLYAAPDCGTPGIAAAPQTPVRSASCLKFGRGGDYGLIRLSP